MKKLIFTCSILFFTFAAQADTFRSDYLQLDIPDGWGCALEGAEWVCIERTKPGFRQGLIVFRAKQKSPVDTFAFFTDYLKKPKSFANESGKKIDSVPIKVDELAAHGQKWVRGVHLSSEIENYQSIYLTTIKENLVVLVTFTFHQDFLNQYAPYLEKAQKNLQIIANPELLAQGNGVGSNSSSPTSPIENSDTTAGEAPPPSFNWMILGAGLVGLVLVFLYLKRR